MCLCCFLSDLLRHRKVGRLKLWLLDRDAANVGMVVNIAVSLSRHPIWGSVTVAIFMLYYEVPQLASESYSCTQSKY